MTNSLSIPPLTTEQQAIVDACPRRDNGGQLTRITAAAGTGKTTTLLALAVRATVELGHDHITYVTFTKAAALDGKKRLEAAIHAHFAPGQRPTVEASTLHSCAHHLLKHHLGRPETEQDYTLKMWSDKEVQAWIEKTCNNEINSFTKACYTEIGKRSRKNSELNRRQQQEKVRDQVVFFIYKSLVYFCQSNWSLEEYQEGSMFNRDYYPIKLFHTANGKGEDYGFTAKKYFKSDSIAFYAQQAARLWSLAVRQHIRCYDIEMKQTQLLKLRVAGTLILVDESQDMDACQIDWIAQTQSQRYRTSVTVVGDPAQAIYGFRGAKPQFLLSLPCQHTYMLTESWRFGPAISNIANLVLYGKHQSKQTGDTNKTWVPYRTRAGVPDKESLVTTKPLIQQWKSGPVTVIARANATLLLEVLAVLGFSVNDVIDVDAEEDREPSIDDLDEDEVMNFVSQESPKSAIPGPASPFEIPKVHIFGRGEGSGLKLWKTTMNLVQSVYTLFATASHEKASPTLLDSKLFPEFAGRAVTWKSFIEECEQKELSRYSNVIRVVTNCREKTLAAMKAFQEHVLDRSFTAEEADIVLVTCHSAKGMEWDRVQVCNDFIELCSFEKKAGSSASFSQEKKPAKNRRLDDAWQFGFENWGDELNLAYVACTRAKRVLSIPPCIHAVLNAFDTLHQWKFPVGEEDTKGKVKTFAITMPGVKNDVLTEEQAHCFYDSLILRKIPYLQ